jgi:putative ABC transport system permease protein
MMFWKIAFRNVKKNWRHSLSALLSLSASFVSLVLFDGYIDNLKSMYEDSFRHRQMLGDLVIEKPKVHSKEGLSEPWKYSLFENEQLAIDRFFFDHQDLVKFRVRFLNFQGMISNGSQSTILMGRGFDLSEGLKVRGKNWSWNATFGEPLHVSNESSSIILGQGLARKLGCRFTKPKDFYTFNGGYKPENRPFDCPTHDLQISLMTDQAQLNAIDVKAVGLFDAGYKDIDDRLGSVSLETAQLVMNTKSVSLISVQLNKENQFNEFVKLFREKIETEFPEIKAMSWMDHPVGETYIKTLELMSVFRNFVIVVILVISTLSVVNTLIKIIKERNREIGTLRSMGFKSSQVLNMFVYETFMLTVLGSTIGLFLSMALTLLLNSVGIRYKAGLLSEPVLFKINFSYTAYLNAFFVLLLVSFLACLISTRQTLKKKVIENLSHV